MYQPPENFASQLVADQHCCCFLWKPDGTQASSIFIRKEIWLNINGKGDGLGDGTLYPVFHLYNYLDPSTAHSAYSGCRVNPLDKPYTKLDECLAEAARLEEAVLASGKWVPVEMVKRNQPE
ncbi:MAG: hypothetical protein WC270_03395 [Patescibacteria group bacterium]|jgi:hypothetical protein